MRVQFQRNSPHRARRRTREPRTERTAPSCPYGSWDHLSARKNSCLSVATNRTRSPPMHLVANGISHRSQPLIARWLGLSPWLRDCLGRERLCVSYNNALARATPRNRRRRTISSSAGKDISIDQYAQKTERREALWLTFSTGLLPPPP